MKFYAIFIYLLFVLLSPTIAKATELQDINLSGIPNTFVNGDVADANEINENFQYLQNNFQNLVNLLTEQGMLSTDLERFIGTYKVSGLEMVLDSCEPVIPEIKVRTFEGTAISNGAVLNFSTHNRKDAVMQIELGTTSSLNFSNQNEPFSASINSNGTLTAGGSQIGQMSVDGSSFTVIYSGTEGPGGNEGTCHSYSGQLVAIRTSK